jgi:hypothetical protein
VLIYKARAAIKNEKARSGNGSGFLLSVDNLMHQSSAYFYSMYGYTVEPGPEQKLRLSQGLSSRSSHAGIDHL